MSTKAATKFMPKTTDGESPGMAITAAITLGIGARTPAPAAVSLIKLDLNLISRHFGAGGVLTA